MFWDRSYATSLVHLFFSKRISQRCVESLTHATNPRVKGISFIGHPPQNRPVPGLQQRHLRRPASIFSPSHSRHQKVFEGRFLCPRFLRQLLRRSEFGSSKTL